MKFRLAPILPLALLALPAAALTVGETHEGTLDATDGTTPEGKHIETHTLALTEGETVTLTLRSDVFDPYLEVDLPDGQSLADDDSGGNFDAQVVITGAPAGEATVRVTSYGPGESGAYTLSAAGLRAEAEMTLTPGQAATGTFTLESEQRVIALNAPAGARLSVGVSSTDFDTVLTALGAAGSVTNDDADGTNSRVHVEVPESGRTLLLVSSYDERQGGFTVQAGEVEASGAPAFSLVNLEGQPVASSQFDGKIRIIDFWATWCPPCRAEIPHFIEIAEEYADDVAVIGISNEEPGVVRQFVEQTDVNYTMLIDANRQAISDYGAQTPEGVIRGIPTTFVVDRDGEIAEIFVGYRDKQIFVDAIERLLAAN